MIAIVRAALHTLVTKTMELVQVKYYPLTYIPIDVLFIISFQNVEYISNLAFLPNKL